MRHQETRAPAAPLPGAAGYRFAVIVSRFNESITDALRDGARAALAEAGVAPSDIEELQVPGAFELPQAARCAAETGRFDAIVCLGCVIRGATPHFEYISSAVAHGIMDAAGETGVPMAFGVLTTDNEAQAAERAQPGRDNKGWEAAAAAIDMARLFRTLAERPRRSMSTFDPSRAGAARARRRFRCSTSRKSGAPARTKRSRRTGPRMMPSMRSRSRSASSPTGSCEARPRGSLKSTGCWPRTRRTGGSSGWRSSIAWCSGSAVYELLAQPATPPRVVINEALELARRLQRRGGGGVRQRRAGLHSQGAEARSLKSCQRTIANPISLRQRRANFEELVRLGWIRTRTGSSGPTRLRISWPHTRPKPRRSSKAPGIHTRTAGRVLAIRSFGKANFLVISDGTRAIQATSARTPCRKGLRGLQAARFRRLHRHRREVCSAPRPTS